MTNLFFISDTHFSHKNVIKFKLEDDSFLRVHPAEKRPFVCVEEMDEYIVARWNSVVTPQDKVYHLGDFALGKNPSIAARLNGHKRLVRGNHDGFRLKEYAKYFEEVYGIRHLPGCVMSHVPIHPDSLNRWGLNLHGHLHAYEVMHHATEFDINQDDIPDTRYFNCAVERINYTPISVEEVRQKTGRKIL